jgi:hypothetical protein
MSTLCAIATLALLSTGGAVHTVDDDSPADFTNIQAAIDAAAPGDLILVKTGGYAGFSLFAKSVDVIADSDALVQINGKVQIAALPVGSSTVLRGLQCTVPKGRVLVASNCLGSLWIDSCTLEGVLGDNTNPFVEGSPHGADFLQCSNVILTRNTLIGGFGTKTILGGMPVPGGSGVKLRSSTAVINDCTAVGGNAPPVFFESWHGTRGGDGILAQQSTLWVGGFTSFGGKGGDADEGSDFTCGDAGDGGSGVYLDAGSPACKLVLRDQVCTPGIQGQGLCGLPGKPGQPLTTKQFGPNPPHSVTLMPGEERQFWANSPVRMGSNARFYFQGSPGDIALAAVSTSQLPLALPGQALPLLVADLGYILPLNAPTAQGFSITTLPVPVLGLPIEGLTLTVQCAVVEAETGQLQLAPGSALTLLAPGL